MLAFCHPLCAGHMVFALKTDVFYFQVCSVRMNNSLLLHFLCFLFGTFFLLFWMWDLLEISSDFLNLSLPSYQFWHFIPLSLFSILPKSFNFSYHILITILSKLRSPFYYPLFFFRGYYFLPFWIYISSIVCFLSFLQLTTLCFFFPLFCFCLSYMRLPLKIWKSLLKWKT